MQVVREVLIPVETHFVLELPADYRILTVALNASGRQCLYYQTAVEGKVYKGKRPKPLKVGFLLLGTEAEMIPDGTEFVATLPGWTTALGDLGLSLPVHLFREV